MTGAELASIAKHLPEGLFARADDVRWCGRRLECFEASSVRSIVADGGLFTVTLVTSEPTVWTDLWVGPDG